MLQRLFRTPKIRRKSQWETSIGWRWWWGVWGVREGVFRGLCANVVIFANKPREAQQSGTDRWLTISSVSGSPILHAGTSIWRRCKCIVKNEVKKKKMFSLSRWKAGHCCYSVTEAFIHGQTQEKAFFFYSCPCFVGCGWTACCCKCTPAESFFLLKARFLPVSLAVCKNKKKKEHDKICFQLSFNSFRTWDHNLQNKR